MHVEVLNPGCMWRYSARGGTKTYLFLQINPGRCPPGSLPLPPLQAEASLRSQAEELKAALNQVSQDKAQARKEVEEACRSGQGCGQVWGARRSGRHADQARGVARVRGQGGTQARLG